MKYLLISIMLTISISADNYWDQDDDKPYFQQRDNLAHIGVSTVASYLASDYAQSKGFTKTESWFIGMGTALLIGTVKELTDKNFNYDDLANYAVGGAIGSSIVIWRW